MSTVKELEDEMRRRGMLVSEESVLAGPKTTPQQLQTFGESLLKGSARGIVGLLGGWGNLYDYLNKSKSPSAFSSSGIMQGIKDLTGVDINKIQGYSGAYEFGAAGGPAAAFTALGVPGLFSRTIPGVAAEFGVAGSTGMLAQSIAPESMAAQLAIQSLPYAAKAGYLSTQRAVNVPQGPFPSTAETQELLRVGRMTPGELSQNRAQLATEARVESAPASGQAPIAFRQGQALDVENFLSNLFERSAGAPVDVTRAQATTASVFNAFNNFGKALSGKLRSDAARDFGAAKRAGGLIDTAPVVDAARRSLSAIAPEEPGFATLKQSLDRIIDEYAIPAQPAKVTPSVILGPTGQPASVTVTPEVAAASRKIDIKRLQDNLAIWGDAAYSGKVDFGKGNIFEGVAPGKAKGIALNVLQGFRQSLDDAIDSNVPGADQLVQARNNFRDNIKRIEEFANRPLTREFDVPDVSALVPEDVIAKLKRKPASQQALLLEVMQSSPNADVAAVLDTIRRSRMDEVLAKGQGNDIQKIARALQAKGDLATLFPNPRDLQDAQLAVKFMQQVLAKESASGAGGRTSAAYAATRAAGGTSVAGLIAGEFASLVNSTLSNPAALSKMLFEPDNRKLLLDLAKKKTTSEKAYNAIKTLSQNTGVIAARGGPALDVGAPESPATAMPTEQAPDEEAQLEAEMRRRGMLE
jgi:hypothetical protein